MERYTRSLFWKANRLQLVVNKSIRHFSSPALLYKRVVGFFGSRFVTMRTRMRFSDASTGWYEVSSSRERNVALLLGITLKQFPTLHNCPVHFLFNHPNPFNCLSLQLYLILQIVPLIPKKNKLDIVFILFKMFEKPHRNSQQQFLK